MNDLRNQKAKARDAFLESPEGVRLIESARRPGESTSRFAKNIIEYAWFAGWDAHERITREATEGDGDG